MQPETPQAGKPVDPESNVNEEAGTLAKLPPVEPSPSQQWSQTGEELSEQIVLLLERAGEVFGEYKPAILAIGIALAAVPFLAFIVAFMSTINAIPLLAPTFKLVGFGFTAWFVYRYLLFAPHRQELSEELKGLRQQVLGDQNQKLPHKQFRLNLRPVQTHQSQHPIQSQTLNHPNLVLNQLPNQTLKLLNQLPAKHLQTHLLKLILKFQLESKAFCS